jgi:hypothetical protein
MGLTQIFIQSRILPAKLLDFFLHRVALGLRPSTDLRDEEEHRGRLALQQRLPLL